MSERQKQQIQTLLDLLGRAGELSAAEIEFIGQIVYPETDGNRDCPFVTTVGNGLAKNPQRAYRTLLSMRNRGLV